MNKIAVFIIAAFIVFMAIDGFCQEGAKKGPEEQKQQVMPKKISVDTNYDGKPDRTEYYDEKGAIIKAEVDSNGDGSIEETIIYEKGKPVKGVKDSNKDGKPDVWIDF